jgi:hypothetical protein
MHVLRPIPIGASTAQVWKLAAQAIDQAITSKGGSITARAMKASSSGHRLGHTRGRSGCTIVSNPQGIGRVSEARGYVRRLALDTWGIVGICVGRNTLHLRSIVATIALASALGTIIIPGVLSPATCSWCPAPPVKEEACSAQVSDPHPSSPESLMVPVHN